MKKLRELSIAHSHRVIAALAALLVLILYVPGVYLSGITADHVQIPLLFHDVVVEGHPARDWVWGGHCDLFPDITIVFAFDSILRNGLLSVDAAAGLVLAAYIAAVAALYLQAGGRNAGTFAAALLLLFVLMLINFGASHGVNFANFLSMTMHTSVAVTALGCFALCLRTVSAGWGKTTWLLPALCFATIFSDDLFLVLFPVPVAAVLFATSFLYRGRAHLFLALGASILAASIAGHMLAPVLSPWQIDAGPFTHFHAAAAKEAWREFCSLCPPSSGGVFIVFVALDILCLAFTAGICVSQCLKPAASRMPVARFMLLLFSSCVIGSDWGAAILTGDFNDAMSVRYTRLAMLLPAFILLGYANDAVNWSRAASRWTISLLSIATCLCVLFWRPAPGRYYVETQRLIPILRETMQQEHIEAGLADYWYANLVAFFSAEALPIRAVSADGGPRHWVNTTLWYKGSSAADKPPEFRLILTANLDEDKVRQRYGPPSKIIPALPGKDIWVYSAVNSIRYNPVFGGLSNGPVNEYDADGSLMPSLTGKIEGRSRVAREGRDIPTFLVYGPYPYLSPAAGRYRITIVHTYLSAPDPGRLALYDVTYAIGPSSRTLDELRIPCIDSSRRDFTREIVIPDDKRGLLQVRVQYFGSGDLSIDSLKIVYLGK